MKFLAEKTIYEITGLQLETNFKGHTDETCKIVCIQPLGGGSRDVCLMHVFPSFDLPGFSATVIVRINLRCYIMKNGSSYGFFGLDFIVLG